MGALSKMDSFVTMLPQWQWADTTRHREIRTDPSSMHVSTPACVEFEVVNKQTKTHQGKELPQAQPDVPLQMLHPPAEPSNCKPEKRKGAERPVRRLYTSARLECVHCPWTRDSTPWRKCTAKPTRAGGIVRWEGPWNRSHAQQLAAMNLLGTTTKLE